VGEHYSKDVPAEREPVDSLRLITLGLLAAMVLAVIGLAAYLVTYVRDQRLTAECYATAFEELNASLLVSREAAKQDRGQLRTLVTALIVPDGDQDSVRVALDNYVAALDAADRDRAAAPLPNRTCS
jgi:hypothetical protein